MGFSREQISTKGLRRLIQEPNQGSNFTLRLLRGPERSSQRERRRNFTARRCADVPAPVSFGSGSETVETLAPMLNANRSQVTSGRSQSAPDWGLLARL